MKTALMTSRIPMKTDAIFLQPSGSLSDSEVRIAALDMNRSYLLEAPAGSGKTSVLVQRFLAALTTVEKPEQVLAITFTRKAAAEMQARIFEALIQSQSPTPPQEAFRRQTWDLGQQVLKRSASKQWDLLHHPARLQISTIDGLCRKIASAAPISSGLGTIPDLTDHPNFLFSEAVGALLSTFQNPPGLESQEVPKSFYNLLALYLGELGKLRQDLLLMLASRERWVRTWEDFFHEKDPEKQAHSINELVSEMKTTLFKVLGPMVEELWQQFQSLNVGNVISQIAAYPELYKQICEKVGPTICPPVDTLAHFSKRPSESSESYDVVRFLAEWFTNKSSDCIVRSKADRYMGLQKRYLSDLGLTGLSDLVTSILDGLRQGQWEGALKRAKQLPHIKFDTEVIAALSATIRVLMAAWAHLIVKIREYNQCDFSEMSHRAIQALGQPWELNDVSERFDASFRHILLDEFQDTSLSQVQLLGALTKAWDEPGPDGTAHRTLFLVGDPMQSIYLFRQADVSLFLRAKNQATLNRIPLTCLSLTNNFRSREGLVEFVNRTFEKVLPKSDDPTFGAVGSRKALANRGCGTVDPVVANFSFNESGQPSLELSEIEAVVQAAEAALGRAANDPANDSREGEQRSPVAILVRAKEHATKIVEALNARRIGTTLVDLDSLADRPHIQDFVHLIQALAHPGNRLAWAAIFRSPAIGLSYKDLLSLSGTPYDSPLPTDLLTDGNSCPQHIENERPFGSRARSKATRFSLYSMACDEKRRELLSPQGRAQLERALPILTRGVDQWGKRPTHLLVEGVWYALGYALGYPEVPAEELQKDFQASLDVVAGMELSGESLESPTLLERLKTAKTPQRSESPHRVTIMTIHKSKGLEWDTVILPGLNRKGRGEIRTLLTAETVTLSSGPHLLFSPIPPANATKEKVRGYGISEFLKTLKKERLDNELRRLLYVAMTRAREQLVLTVSDVALVKGSFFEALRSAFPFPVAPITKASAPFVASEAHHEVAPPELSGVLATAQLRWPDMPRPLSAEQKKKKRDELKSGDSTEICLVEESSPCAILVKALVEGMASRAREHLGVIRKRWCDLQSNPQVAVRHLPSTWKPPILPKTLVLPRPYARPERTADEMENQITASILPGRTLALGRAYHRAMEGWGHLGIGHRGDAALLERKLQELARRALTLESQPTQPEDFQRSGSLAKDLLTLLHTTFRNPGMERILSWPTETETSFCALNPDGLSVGRADRILAIPSLDFLAIIDYKVVEHQGGSLREFLLGRAKHYQPQLERYAQFLPTVLGERYRKPPRVVLGLYFSAQDKWYCWEPGTELTEAAERTDWPEIPLPSETGDANSR
jgi:ATP-dependent exoDNAse (exonuclease V) beta subunit